MYWANYLVRACTLTLAVLATGSSVLQPIAPSKQAVQPRTRAAATSAATAFSRTRQVAVQAAYGKLPLQFEANQGQSDEQVRFLARGSGYTLFLTAIEAVLALPQKPESRRQESEVQSSDSRLTLRMQLVGANPQPYVTGEAELPGKSNYFFSNDPAQWRTGIPTYARVKYENVYPGVDLVYYGTQQQLEYDFVLAPGADPKVIRVAFNSIGAVREPLPHIDTIGDLVLNTGNGELRFHQPRIYQDINGSKQAIAGRYVLFDSETADSEPRTQQVGFEVTAYDTTKPLVVDPVLVYSTFLGGSNSDGGHSIAVDAEGNAYVTGFTSSTDFPTVAGAVQPSCNSNPVCVEAFVAKLNAAGSALLYATYLGGKKRNLGFGINHERDYGTGIAVDTAGNAYVTGLTTSLDFPTTIGAFQPACHIDSAGLCDDAFVVKLNTTGSALVYSTYLGGSSYDASSGIAIDPAGNAYVTGEAPSLDFPTTIGAFQPACHTDSAGLCDDAFVVKLNATGSALVYSTYLGGGNSDVSNGIAVDPAGNVYVTGQTNSNDFPITPAAFDRSCGTDGNCNALPSEGAPPDGFVTKLNPTGSALVYSTYLGGSSYDASYNIAVDTAGNAYVTGFTASLDFPTTMGAFQPACHTDSAGLCDDAFVVKLNTTGSALVYSTYLGGGNSDVSIDIAVDAIGNVYLTGRTSSPNFPTTEDAFQPTCSRSSGSCSEDAFVTKLNPAGSELVYSTYLGGIASDVGLGVAVDTLGNAYVTGATNAPDFPTENPLQPTFDSGFCEGPYDIPYPCADEAFVAKLTDTPPPRGRLVSFFESPENSPSTGLGPSPIGPVSGITVIRGWAFATPPAERIASIKLLIDGTAVDDIPCCSERRDVQVAFPEFPADNTLHSGWGIAFNWGLLRSSSHTVRAFIHSTTGKQLLTDTRIVTVVKPGDFEYLDDFDFSGATARVQDDDLILNGVIVRDKATQQKKIINAFFRWSLSSQSFGMIRAETVIASSSLRSPFSAFLASLPTWSLGWPFVGSAQAAPGLTAAFESPTDGEVVAGVATVRGWAFSDDPQAIITVRLVIDGQLAWTVLCCSRRGDVTAAFPSHPNALTSGWGTVLNYGTLTSGLHSVGVQITDSTGAVRTLTRLVNVVKPGGFEFLDQFDLSHATVLRIEEENIILSGVVVRDKASQQSKTVDVRLRWVAASQGLGIVAASDS